MLPSRLATSTNCGAPLSAPGSERSPAVHCHGDILAGRYRLLRPLAEGGMGSVWSARCLALDLDVAVKVVKRSVASPWACERLLREARAAASLVHPSIVRVLDFGTADDGEPFLVMELLRGETLGAKLRERGRLPAVLAVQLVLPLVSALVEVHSLEIVHRDIKPENIVLEEGPDGRLVPKLVDFGIAKWSGAETLCFTQSGVLMGSPAYMSPEQARGERQVDSRSDIWSLTAVLYEMVTGRRPFDGPNHGAILFAVFADTPAPTHAQGAGDVALWEIIRRGLGKNPEERWQSVSELGDALAAWAAESDTPEKQQATNEITGGHRRSTPPTLAGPGDTLSSPAIGAAPPEERRSVAPRRRRGVALAVCGALCACAAATTFLVSLSAAPVVGGTTILAPLAVAAPFPRAPLRPSAPEPRVFPAVPVATSVLPLASAAPATTRPSATNARSPGGAASGRRPIAKTPMPLPRGPDF